MKKSKVLYILYSFLLLMLIFVVVLIFLAFASPVREVSFHAPNGKVIVDNYSASQLDSIEGKYTNVTIIPEYREVILTVLGNYPEFENVRINFEYSTERTTMASRPDVLVSLIGDRTYNVFINNNKDFEGILLSDVPRSAQIGVIAHELAHILQYEAYSNTGILQLGLMFLDEDSQKIFERETDVRTISRGFGEHLKAWAQYSMYDSPKATQEYKEFKRRIYMSPKEIEEEMKNYSCYNESEK